MRKFPHVRTRRKQDGAVVMRPQRNSRPDLSPPPNPPDRGSFFACPIVSARVGRRCPLLLAVLALVASGLSAENGPPVRIAPRDVAVLVDGSRVTGRLTVERGAVWFQPAAEGHPVRARDLREVRFENSPAVSDPDPIERRPPADLIRLSDGQQVVGCLLAMDDTRARIRWFNGESLEVPRAGISSVIHRRPAMLLLADSFEQSFEASVVQSLASDSSEAAARKSADRTRMTNGSLRLEEPGAAIQWQLTEPLDDACLELRFFDQGRLREDASWFVQFLLAGRPIRIVLGGASEVYALDAPQGPGLAVQRIARSAGWHRLTARVTSGSIAIDIDQQPLAEGSDHLCGLSEISISRSQAARSKDAPPEAPAECLIDDVRLWRLPCSLLEHQLDPAQDAVLLAKGDVIYGRIVSCTMQEVRIAADFGPLRFDRNAVRGVCLAPQPVPQASVEGCLVSLRLTDPERATVWGIGLTDEGLPLEGALVGIDEAGVQLFHAYLGNITIPREWLDSLELTGCCRRIQIDPLRHHLGHEDRPDLEAGPPEGDQLTWQFELPEAPRSRSYVVLAVRDLEPEDSPHLGAGPEGHLRTVLEVNDHTVGDLNQFAFGHRGRFERIRVMLPAGCLNQGQNQIAIHQVLNSAKPELFDELAIAGLALEIEEPLAAQ